jgi:hypothetical protein
MAGRALNLNRETLVELTPDELTTIVGGRQLPSIPVRACVSDPQHCVTTI